MMEIIRLNLAVYDVPVIPGRPPGQGERLAQIGDVPTRYLPPAPRHQPFPGPLCGCGVRHR